MYTRRGCHLCDDAWATLEKAKLRYPFSLTAIDVDEDPDLLLQYGNEVPVTAINDRVQFRGGLNAVLLNRVLRSLARKRK